MKLVMDAPPSSRASRLPDGTVLGRRGKAPSRPASKVSAGSSLERRVLETVRAWATGAYPHVEPLTQDYTRGGQACDWTQGPIIPVCRTLIDAVVRNWNKFTLVDDIIKYNESDIFALEATLYILLQRGQLRKSRRPPYYPSVCRRLPNGRVVTVRHRIAPSGVVRYQINVDERIVKMGELSGDGLLCFELPRK
jgi:hypothetical protein